MLAANLVRGTSAVSGSFIGFDAKQPYCRVTLILCIQHGAGNLSPLEDFNRALTTYTNWTRTE